MKSSEMQFSEQDISNLFSLPQVLVQLLEVCLDDDGIPNGLPEIILQDAPLAARIIHAASKTCPTTLDSTEPLSSAISQLGLPVIKGIALQSAKRLISYSFTESELIFLQDLWYRSRVAGQTARCLAATVSYPNVEEAELAGLFLNLGVHLHFARHNSHYVELAETAVSNPRLRNLEKQAYQVDHLQLGEELVSSWQLDSFLVDAIRFQHFSPQQIIGSSQLLKVARLAQQIACDPEQLGEKTVEMAQQIFDFRITEIEYLFDWARSLYREQPSTVDGLQRLQTELKAAFRYLTEQSFMLADQEGARARLACSCSPEELVNVARSLYLENSSATEAVFFIVDQKSNQLIGLPAAGQPQLVGELKISLDDTVSFISHTLLNGELGTSPPASVDLAVTDHLLLRFCNSAGIYYQPFRYEEHLCGVVALGVADEQAVASLQSQRLKVFSRVIAGALQQMIKRMQDQLGDGFSQLRQVCHEVSNPLTIISNYAEVLRHVLDGSENSILAEVIKKEVRRVDDILGYYLNQQELPRFPDQDVCLNRLVHEALEALQDSEIKPRNIEVEFDLQEDLGLIETNGILVKQILINLVKNAAEAIENKGVIVLSTRVIHCSDGDRYVEIVVQDNGPGIDDITRAKLFQPVISTKGAGHAGVGLSIVKSMVDDLGGRISCQTNTPSGAEFCFQIPSGSSSQRAGMPVLGEG